MIPRIFFLIACLCISLSVYSQKKRQKISDYEIVVDTMTSRAPGCWIPMGIRLNKKSGSKAATKGYLKGSYSWNNFVVEVTGGKFRKGYIQISDNPEDFPDEKIIIYAYPVEDPELKKSYILKIDYSGNFSANYSGTHGRNGFNGRSGCNSTGHGGNGDDGGHGKNGSDGYDLEVLVNIPNRMI